MLSTEPALVKSLLPPGVVVVERGWLSSNMIFLEGRDELFVVDTGYCSHSEQTLAFVESAIERHPMGDAVRLQVLNTHLHSDHCGGNAAIQTRYPLSRVLVPLGSWRAVQLWVPFAKSVEVTGQTCVRFSATSALMPGSTLVVGSCCWQALSAPGHDLDSLILFEPQTRTLISADALWEDGFGVVFPELEGVPAFGQVGATLDLIESLDVKVVIPGHGGIFLDAAAALRRARSRLAFFEAYPEKHATHAAKVLLAFKALEWGRFSETQVQDWASSTEMMNTIFERVAAKHFSVWLGDLCSSFKSSHRWTACADGMIEVVT